MTQMIVHMIWDLQTTCHDRRAISTPLVTPLGHADANLRGAVNGSYMSSGQAVEIQTYFSSLSCYLSPMQGNQDGQGGTAYVWES